LLAAELIIGRCLRLFGVDEEDEALYFNNPRQGVADCADILALPSAARHCPGGLCSSPVTPNTGFWSTCCKAEGGRMKMLVATSPHLELGLLTVSQF
jgi:hypothetical protein